MMKAWIVNKPGSLDNLQLVDLADPGAPAAGEIRVALHATSLNYHDLLVATGVIPTADRRILMAVIAGPILSWSSADRAPWASLSRPSVLADTSR
ncbi:MULTISPECIES: hypothetical protein [Klebsiella]|uniref:hypothetical protein n=1 Tax=Klebsiella TaxID=570 RepID=UPI001D0D3B67|nr:MULTISPECIES: hypothetical protein [Klebsiella]MCJ7361610.1 hypothetical protein [Klebsiella quasipneumoniae]MDD9215173.1 hypothetical protein [Klebsiella quasipneumoniae]UNA88420.1 hypothetical protein KZ661_25215 [Klebsiella quasipneumoniae]